MQTKFFQISITIFLVLFSVNLFADEKFISVADIHFNPFAGCEKVPAPCPLVIQLQRANYSDWETIFKQLGEKKLSTYSQDTNYPLFKFSLLELRKINQQEHPEFVLVLGDFLAHNFYRQYARYSKDRTRAGYRAFVEKTLQFMTYQFQLVFPTIDVYPAIGNNDSYTGNYGIVPRGEFFQDAMNAWLPLIKDKTNRGNFRRNFPVGGYYTVNLSKHENDCIIMLNTVIFSARAKGENLTQAAEQELAWLHQQLLSAKAQRKKVILAFHIPVGIDVVATLRNKFNISEYWKPAYSQQFENELKDFSNVVTEMLPAHIHIDILRFIVLKELADIPVSFTPSISPIFGNDPGVKVFTYDPATFTLKKFDTYYFPLTKKLAP